MASGGLSDREREEIVRTLTRDVQSLKEMVQCRESELVKLHREIHKLKVRKGEPGSQVAR